MAGDKKELLGLCREQGDTEVEKETSLWYNEPNKDKGFAYMNIADIA